VICAPVNAAELSLFQARELYKETLVRIDRGQSIKKQAKALENYPLRPYLDYHTLNRKLYQSKAKPVIAFQQSHSQLPVTQLMFNRWLRNLGKRGQWQTLRDNYVATTNAELRCYHLRALYASEDKERALDQTKDLWLRPVSQPKACDPLFDVWRNTDRFTEDVAWQRLEGAIGANQRTLARYLLRFFTGENKTTAEAYYRFHITPSRVTRTSAYSIDSQYMRVAIQHGLTRLAANDAEKADKAWQRYAKSHDFDTADSQWIEAQLAIGRASQGTFPSADTRSTLNDEVALALSSAAVANQSWDEAVYWIERLEPHEHNKIKWQYWLARALQVTQTDASSSRAQDIFNRIGSERHYYGFLAASRLGLQGTLNTVNSRSPQWKHILNDPGVERAVELFAVGDDINGRREWYRALEGMNQSQQTSAGHMARSIGRVPLSIRTANIAEALDDLTLRFPVVYEPQFRRASAKVDVPVSFLFAIARQESAFDPSALSAANARGLMQVLPATATLIARRANTPAPNSSQLYDPAINVTLGTYHVAWLLDRYGGQTPLAIAAYNAGEHRVDRWIKGLERMPMDIWIERIPFRETRDYVKNVLAFKHVYSQRLGMPTPMLGANERAIVAR